MSTYRLISVRPRLVVTLIPAMLLLVFSLAGGCGKGTDSQPIINAGGDDGGSSGSGGSASSGSGGSSGTSSSSGTGGSSGGSSTCTGSSGGSSSGNVVMIPMKNLGNRTDVIISQGTAAATWKFNQGDVPGAEAIAFADAAWTTVTLPHTWNNMDGQDGPFGIAYYRGIGWYRTHYMMPAITSGQRVYLQFDESAYITDAFVNGNPVGTHKGGYAAFRFDITASAMPGGDNVIAVKVDNSQAVTTGNIWVGGAMADVAPISGDFTLFGGIERDVHVLTTDPLAISPMDFGSPGVYLKTASITPASADLTATVRLLNSGTAPANATVSVEVFDASAASVAKFTGMQMVPPGTTGADAVITGKIMNPHLWNGLADPYLYHANVYVTDGTSKDGVQPQPLGIRSYVLDANTGFSLNGKPYPLRGVCMHQDHKDKGGELSPPDIDNDFAMLKEIGANVVRFAHYQHSDYTYTKADEAGIVSWAENAFVNRVPQACASTSACAAFMANTQQQLTELIRQNYNHPAIFFWSLGNEVLLKFGPDPIVVMQNLAAVGKMEDPSRTIVFAANAGTDTNPTDWTPQATFFNEYYGWYYLKASGFAAWADGIHAAHPTTALGVSEYGAGANPAIHALPITDPGGDRTATNQTEEYQNFFHETYYQAILTRPFLTITTVWNMFDFASDYRNEGPGLPGLNTKGLVSYDRSIKKDAFYYYKANWKDPAADPFVYITSRRFTTMPKSATTIKVYSNQPSVELKLNGTSLGMQTASNHIFQWTAVKWVAGANKIDASACAATDSVTFMN